MLLALALCAPAGRHQATATLKRARVVRLTAPTLDATDGIQVDGDDPMTGMHKSETVDASRIPLPHASAALVWITG